MEDGYNASKKIMINDKPPFGLFCYSDYIAIGALHALRNSKYKIPEEISIVGHDNIEIINYLDIPITTINQPQYKMGVESTKILLKIIRSKEFNTDFHSPPNRH